ncbi:3-hydroxybutyrate dehydrogenase [Cobetia sp. 14N.309.X.WAT.E.A4]|uniref:3-hydroxybutyrate dehydrogenase n=1 Tax=Cobetia sp. 14N.309.X.WAT.E.A4 TaxID=2998323 RepID=UPI0025B0FF28|nr:3-hydroxybutyrate dehydrogenase [Cobetia sp. 14N.309.X.WAT.E.A4]MDN2656165.1 3-hydroxybutyrate dehydrogenase [Cobetia sp. 14N.309.X.WAT.E.A4]
MSEQQSAPTRVALVTGTASGIGAAIMEAMCQAGHQVLAVDFSDDGAEVADKAGAAFFKADLTDGEQCRAAVEEAVSRFGRLDILVNNAGIQHVERIKEFPQAKWDQIIALMLTAPFTLIQAAWPHMEKNGYGRIVNMASIHAHVASPGKAAYVSAKHGLMGLTRTAALEGGESGITANAICPAYVRTPLVDKQIAEQARLNDMPEDEVIEKIMLKGAAIKRMIDPAEVADMAVWLASDKAGSVTGSSFNMDLGWTAH